MQQRAKQRLGSGHVSNSLRRQAGRLRQVEQAGEAGRQLGCQAPDGAPRLPPARLRQAVLPPVPLQGLDAREPQSRGQEEACCSRGPQGRAAPEGLLLGAAAAAECSPIHHDGLALRQSAASQHPRPAVAHAVCSIAALCGVAALGHIAALPFLVA